MDKLISMTDFVLSGKWDKASSEPYSKENLDRITKYANFLKRPLELGMFIPCDEDGNLLEEPYNMDYPSLASRQRAVTQYQKAKDLCLFECDFLRLQSTYGCLDNGRLPKIIIDKFTTETIEDLIPYNLTLTDKALKLWN
jgi:hypothetical protein